MDEPEPAMAEVEPPKWACTTCSFENYGALNECEMCETARPVEGWYDASMEGPLSNGQVVEQVRQITECDVETAVGAMLHMTNLAKLENGNPPPALGSFEAEHIQILVSIVMDPLKWMKNAGGRLQADGSRTPSTLFINGQEAMMKGDVLI